MGRFEQGLGQRHWSGGKSGCARTTPLPTRWSITRPTLIIKKSSTRWEFGKNSTQPHKDQMNKISGEGCRWRTTSWHTRWRPPTGIGFVDDCDQKNWIRNLTNRAVGKRLKPSELHCDERQRSWTHRKDQICPAPLNGRQTMASQWVKSQLFSRWWPKSRTQSS